MTERGRSRGVYVLVVHDASIDVSALCDTLRDLFIVRDTTSAFDTLERLAGSPLACVVCVIGGSIVGEDFYELVKRASPEQAARGVFVATTKLSEHEVAFLKKIAAHLLPEHWTPKVVQAVVGAVSGKR